MATKRKKKTDTESYPNWTVTIDDGYCDYQYTLSPKSGDASIYEVYEVVRKRLKAKETYGVFIS